MNRAGFLKYDFWKHTVGLTDPTVMPSASGFLWNTRMMLQMNCRGYATSQFMQPEPAKYSNSPVQEAPGFMQPEPQYFAHYPGRFFYVREPDQTYSLPYEPMRKELDKFEFYQYQDALHWEIEQQGLVFTLTLRLSVDDTVELWQLDILNSSSKERNIDLVPHFSIGYMSWMNQSADFDADLNGVIGSKITPYQKVDDYFVQKGYQDLTFLIADKEVDSWTASLRGFEGEGGLVDPDGLKDESLGNQKALYETPVAVIMQRIRLGAGDNCSHKFVFGAAKDKEGIASIKKRFLDDTQGFTLAAADYAEYIAQARGCVKVKTPDPVFDQFVNHWLPRQVFYHGDVNRLSTDPQTRNFLQDHMGMIYIRPESFSQAFTQALAQQYQSGQIPDGILLHPDAKLKYINQVPHSDHCVWVSLSLSAYLNETADLAILEHNVGFKDSSEQASVYRHVHLAMQWLLEHLDDRNLSLIAQGDWCDPMNMVGYKGKGVSSWLSMATVWALDSWADICEWVGNNQDAQKWRQEAQTIRDAINELLWDGNWYARGITDSGRVFGVSEDPEGRIYLNPQSWAMLSNTADEVQQSLLISQVNRQLVTPFGVMMLAPAYTKMDTDIGRLTQKFPGVAENGAVYNHAAAFYIYALYGKGKAKQAFELLQAMMIPRENLKTCGQLPVFVPNYYRGAYHQLPDAAGRSSQLFNTGTVAWVYRTVVEQIFGIRGTPAGLKFDPQLPDQWKHVSLTREFRGAVFEITIEQGQGLESSLWLDGKRLQQMQVNTIKKGTTYAVRIEVPANK